MCLLVSALAGWTGCGSADSSAPSEDPPDGFRAGNGDATVGKTDQHLGNAVALDQIDAGTAAQIAAVHPAPPRYATGPSPSTIPATSDGPGCVVPTSVLAHASSSWTVGSHEQNTKVCAGVSPISPKTGLFVVLRHSFIYSHQWIDVVQIPGAGRLTLVRLPEGPGSEQALQEHGTLSFTSESGIGGELHLYDDSITLAG